MKKEEKIIMYDSIEVATFKTNISGWVDIDGRFWGQDEHMARWSGCTHMKCECGNIKTKTYAICEKCRNEKVIERFNALKFKEWDGKEYLCLYDGDKYFWSEDDIIYYLEDNDLKPEDLKLVICKPNDFGNIDPDYWADDLYEDGELPKEMMEKLNDLNEHINKLPPASWSPSDIRTEYKRV